MRVIKVNDKNTRIEWGCGFLPLLRPCGVVSHAHSESYTVNINRGLGTTIISISGVEQNDLDTLYREINNICDNCPHGEAIRIRGRQK